MYRCLHCSPDARALAFPVAGFDIYDCTECGHRFVGSPIATDHIEDAPWKGLSKLIPNGALLPYPAEDGSARYSERSTRSHLRAENEVHRGAELTRSRKRGQ